MSKIENQAANMLSRKSYDEESIFFFLCMYSITSLEYGKLEKNIYIYIARTSLKISHDLICIIAIKIQKSHIN